MDVSVYEGRNQFSKLIEAAERGETTTVFKRGKAVARVVPAAMEDDVTRRLRALRLAEAFGARVTARLGRRLTHGEVMDGKDEGRR